jgi:hypothetical protein
MSFDINPETPIAVPKYKVIGKSIISTLIENIYNDKVYKEYLDDLKTQDTEESIKKLEEIEKTIKDITIFNKTTDPLFLARDIGKIIGTSNISTMIKDYTNTEKVIAIVPSKDGKKENKRILLTRHGLYRVLFTNKSKLSEVFRGFIYKLIDHMFTNEIDTMNHLMVEFTREHPELVSDAMKELEGNIETYKELYEYENRIRIKLEEEYDELDIANNYNSMYIAQLSKEKDDILDRMNVREYEESQNKDTQALDILKKKYMNEIFIYLVQPELIQELIDKNIKDGELDKNKVFMHKEYIDMFPHYIEMAQSKTFNNDRQCYLYMVFDKLKSENQNYVYLTSEYVFNKDGYIELVKELTKYDYYNPTTSNNKTRFIYKTTVNTIKDLCRDLILNSE